MRLLGLDITRAKPAPKAVQVNRAFENLQAPSERGGWFNILRMLEPFAGAWQRNVTLDKDTILSHYAVFACATLAAQDIGKLRLRMTQKRGKIWEEIQSQYDGMFLRPNHYQTQNKFLEGWVICKLLHGNTYVLKVRNRNNAVENLYILDPIRTRPLVAPDGSVFYELRVDNLTGIEQDIIVPAREIIHDRMVCLFHPLIGVSPIYAYGLAASSGINILKNSSSFFGNQSQPGGVLIAPGPITETNAKLIRDHWNANYTGENAGKVAVLGDGVKFERLSVSPNDSRMIEQLKMSAEIVCSAFHIPPYMIGAAPYPSLGNIEAINQQYFQQCLQSLIEGIEESLDEGLELTGTDRGVDIDEEGLLRMDSNARYDLYGKGIGSGVLAPNEARQKENLSPVEGGESPVMQQQNYSLAALARRDNQTEDGTANVQATAMNGAQISSLLQIMNALATGQIPPEAAKAVLSGAFPLLTDDEINNIVDPFNEFVPEPLPGTAPLPALPPPEENPTEDDGDGDGEDDVEDEDKGFDDLITSLRESLAERRMRAAEHA